MRLRHHLVPFSDFKREICASGAWADLAQAWAWVIIKNGKLAIESTPNQGQSADVWREKAVMGLDVVGACLLS